MIEEVLDLASDERLAEANRYRDEAMRIQTEVMSALEKIESALGENTTRDRIRAAAQVFADAGIPSHIAAERMQEMFSPKPAAAPAHPYRGPSPLPDTCTVCSHSKAAHDIVTGRCAVWDCPCGLDRVAIEWADRLAFEDTIEPLLPAFLRWLLGG